MRLKNLMRAGEQKHRVDEPIRSQPVLWVIHTNKINVEVSNYWVTILFLMRSII